MRGTRRSENKITLVILNPVRTLGVRIRPHRRSDTFNPTKAPHFFLIPFFLCLADKNALNFSLFFGILAISFVLNFQEAA